MFHLVAKEKHPFNDPYVVSYLKKWGLQENIRYHVFSYTKNYHKMQGLEIATDLINDPEFQRVFRVCGKDRQWHQITGTGAKVQLSTVPATLTRMDMFDKLVEDVDVPVVRSTGEIAKCMGDMCDGFQVSDRLRELILDRDCDNYSVYSEAERSELLWRIFEHLCLGGGCCQFEDTVGPYLDLTKMIYKELLSVHKQQATGNAEVASSVYRIEGFSSDTGAG